VSVPGTTREVADVPALAISVVPQPPTSLTRAPSAAEPFLDPLSPFHEFRHLSLAACSFFSAKTCCLRQLCQLQKIGYCLDVFFAAE